MLLCENLGIWRILCKVFSHGYRMTSTKCSVDTKLGKDIEEGTGSTMCRIIGIVCDFRNIEYKKKG